MKVIQINTTCGKGSTGKIAVSIANCAKKAGISSIIVYGLGNTSEDKTYRVQSHKMYVLNNLLSRVFSCEGSTNYFSTKKLIKFIDREQPDIIHLHNIHGHYIHSGVLFKYIKKKNIKVIWTLHDCWAFTGQCPYFTLLKCDKWKNGCGECKQFKNYPKYLWDNTKKMWTKKRKWFTGVREMIIVTPSNWLSDLVKQSFLSEYPIKVINNGINLDVFKPKVSNFRKNNNIKKYMILGVSFSWGIRKGLDVFIELSKVLPNNYSIVLVGTDEDIDRNLPKSIFSIHKTQNQEELAEIYSAADVFLMPTREDNYPTVNMEAIACGTPVLTFKTGGSPEMVDRETGVVILTEEINFIANKVVEICEKKLLLSENCVRKASKFDQNDRFQEYIDLYKEMIK